MIKATNEFLAEMDALAKKRIDEILGAKDEVEIKEQHIMSPMTVTMRRTVKPPQPLGKLSQGLPMQSLPRVMAFVSVAVIFSAAHSKPSPAAPMLHMARERSRSSTAGISALQIPHFGSFTTQSTTSGR